MARKILLAEDSLTIQKVFDLTFKQSDVSLTMVDNGSDAVRLAREIAPRLVVVDVTLPDMDGFQVASALREDDATRSCPILLLAGTLPPFDEERYRNCGADGVLFKPFDSQELIDKVEALLHGRGEAAAASAEGEAPALEEPWDFSDVLEEVEEEAGKAGAAPAAAGFEPLPGDLGAYAKAEGRVSLGDFDVSLEELETPPDEVPTGSSAAAHDETQPEQTQPEETLPEEMHPEERHPEEMHPEERHPEETQPEEMHPEEMHPEEMRPEAAAGEEPDPVAAHMEDPFFEDAPAAVTDLTPAIEAAQMLEPPELREGPEPAEALGAGEPAEFLAGPVSPGPPEGPEGAGTAPNAGAPEPPPEDGPAHAAPEDMPHAPEEPAVAAADLPPSGAEGTRPDEEILREQFSARAREILERVASEAVEKVMWEMMDRLSAEFSARVREAVEAVAWDVIPATAEALIREEISRIREQARDEPS